MSSSRIKLVQGDTRPQIKAVISDETTGNIVDISGATVLLKFRAGGTTATLFSLTGYLQPGIEDADGNVTQNLVGETYALAGSGGRVAFQFLAGQLNIEPGYYEGEIEVTFSDSSIQTVYAPLKFQLRAQF
jgi:hypothetical protein